MGKASAKPESATPKPVPGGLSKKEKKRLKRMGKVSKVRVKMGRTPVAPVQTSVAGNEGTTDRSKSSRSKEEKEHHHGREIGKKEKTRTNTEPVQESKGSKKRKLQAEKAQQMRLRRAAADELNAEADLKALVKSGVRQAKAYNALLSKYSVRKQLNFALRVWDAMKSNKVTPTVHTYTNVINASVRCGDIARASDLFREMQQQGLAPNEITYTAYIKGLCHFERLEEADSCLEDMKVNGVVPNTRTYNTLLRGAMRWASADLAAKWFGMMEPGTVSAPDRSSYEYVIRTLCLTPRYKEVEGHCHAMEAAGIKPHATIYAALATALSLYGEIAMARKYVDLGLKVLSQGYGEFLPQHDNESKHRSSLLKFMKMRNREAKRDIEATRTYLDKVEQGTIPKHVGYMHDSDRVVFPLVNDVKCLDKGTYFKDNKPLRMEVCSGLGEWLVSHAQKDPNSNWVGLEIRTERVYSIWSKKVYENVDNVLVLGGEANAIFGSFINDGCLAEVYVNYPDPPIWEESSDCLLNPAFIRRVHAALDDNGAFIVVTDDKRYCETVVQALEQMPDQFRTSLPDGASYSTELPPEYGSSWFDRLWTNGNRTDRYFVKWIKT